MKTAINPGDYVEIIGGEWDGGRGTVQTVYDDGWKIRLPEEGEVKVYSPVTARLPLVETEMQTPGITLKRIETLPATQGVPHYYITDQGFPLTPGDEPNREEVEICKQWITAFVTPRRAINQAWDSRRLRRAVTQWSNRPVGNGAFIKAAVEMGYRYKLNEQNIKNAWFNMDFPVAGTDKFREAFPGRKQ